jgi:hypothetical protein
MAKRLGTGFVRRGLGLGAAIVTVGGWMAPSPTHAAKVLVNTSDECTEASSIEEQVDGLLGRPVVSVEGIDFEVTIDKNRDRRWTLHLDTIGKVKGSRRTRQLTANTCAELADAAAVAITMSIKAVTDTEGHPRPEANPSPADESAAQHEAGPIPSIQRAPDQAPAVPPVPARKSLTVSAVGDAGAMPRAALGLAVDGSLQFRTVRLVAEGAIFAPQDVYVTGGLGGQFQLMLLGVLGCLTDEVGRVTLLGCAGGEGGRLTGTGLGVSSPHAEGTLWLGARAEIGTRLALGPRTALALRAGAVVPVFRPTFQLDDTRSVHQPSAVTGRATAGLELAF